MDIKQALPILVNQQNLCHADMVAVIRQIMSGNATEAQIAGFLVALRCKGESVDDIAAAAEVMREFGSKVILTGEHIIDTCGTGGDGANTFNISTTCAFVVAAAGAKVAKHGNRSVSGVCGSADVLEAAGVNLNLNAEQVADCVNSLGVGFLFAPKYHGAMKHTIEVRKQLGIRTLFNLLGPLANPANAAHQLVGVFDKVWVVPLARVLKQLGSRHVLVVNAEDGLDEISIGSATTVAELKDGEVVEYVVTPEQFGFARAKLAQLAVNDAVESLHMMQTVLANQPGPARDIVALNAGAAIYAADLSASLAEGIVKALEVIADGSARSKFDTLIAKTNSFQI